jgi:predicted RNA-binding Zn-ribbon protein involved in translation (DUF1610 family)
MAKKCPGMDPSNWKFEDIADYRCECGYVIEFWKDDVKRKCPKCGKTVFNPRLGNICLSWCKKADDCLENDDISEWKENLCMDKKPE